jgi:tetratricopeptide (TPR) repeat protein
MRIRNVLNYLAIGLLLATLSLISLAARVEAQTRNTTVQETDDKVKVDTYTRFVDNRKTNPQAAYEAAREYLRIYAKDNDQYTQYLKQWIASYEVDARREQLPRLIYNDKNFAEAFKVGKQVLADDPDNVKALIDLGYAGYLAATAKNETFNADTLAYAKKAIQSIESGKTPDIWEPFKGKDDAQAHLYYTVGFLNLKPAPNSAIEPLIKAIQFDSDIKKTPSAYYFLAAAYEAGPYAKMSADFQKNFGGKPETPESKLALDKLNEVIDRIIDAYARAIAAAGSDPQNAQNKKTWLDRVTVLYKFRHQDSDAGLNDLIAGALTRPLPPKPK